MSYSAIILADSVAKGTDSRLTTMQVTFPRFILAEFNTHRVFSRNSASSRAIPVETRLRQVRENAFVPEAFGVSKRGMQATETLDERDGSKARDVWLAARDAACEQVERMLDLGVHKQHANRLLEPFVWHTVVVSSTEWANFFALRCHPAAQPEMQITANAMRAAYRASTPTELAENQWHLPYTTSADEADLPYLLQLSVVRCAAVSYERQDIERSVDQVVERYNQMHRMGHWSPFEHQAMYWKGLPLSARSNFAEPWWQLRKSFEGEAVFS